jgi:NAD(P) transhydrogenase
MYQEPLLMSDKKFEYDLLVIGSGPAGYRAAIQSSKMGKTVGLIEKVPDQLGGAWIHTGTIPSKTLRETMEQIHSIEFHAGAHWVKRIIENLSTDTLMGRAQNVAKSEEMIVSKYLERNNVTVISGYGVLTGKNEVTVELNDGNTSTFTSDNILISTGSRPRRPADVPFDGWRIVDCDEILNLENVPSSMIIYGGGVIGCEYACIFSALGVEVTLIDGRDKVLQFIDQEVVASLKSSMEKKGVKFTLGTGMKSSKINGPHVDVELDNGETLKGDVLFFAAGRVPNTEKIGLDKLEIKVGKRGHIEVNEQFQTAIPNIYAAGDCIGSPALAATSAVQGRHAATHMFCESCRPFPKVFPLGVYTIPELSSVGKTEEELIEEKVDYVVGRAAYSEVARGYIRGDEHGMLKLLVSKQTQKILGIHIVGHDACNLVHTGQAIMALDGHAQDFVNMVFNYPTLSEAYSVAAFNALNKIYTIGIIQDPPTEQELKSKAS